MNSELLARAEREFFVNKNHMVIPKLLEIYYEQKEFELAYYFCESFEQDFEVTSFYKMMSLMEMRRFEDACEIFFKRADDWFDILHQNKAYWKHVVLFCLYFSKTDLPPYYAGILNQYYDDSLVKLLDFLTFNSVSAVERIDSFRRVLDEYPVLRCVRGGEGGNTSFAPAPRWDERNEYNASINAVRGTDMKLVYDSGVKIYSYKPNEVAASMHIITDGTTAVMLDCGCEIKQDTIERIPVSKILASLNIPKIDAVFVSHAHMDHYGSLNEIRDTKIYMTGGTIQIIKYVSPEISLKNAEEVFEFSLKNIDGVEVRLIPNGHIIGSVLLDIDWKNTKRIVYTGDFSVENQNTVKGLDVKNILETSDKKIDVLITETTYGKKKGMLSLRQYEKMFVKICRKMFESGKKVIIPCFAVGRAQEAALLLSSIAKNNGMRILIDGLAIRLTEYYQIRSRKEILSNNISVCSSDLEIPEKISNNDIILASSGMMKPGSMSYRYIESVINSEDICVMKIGFIHQYEHALISIINRKNKNIFYADVPLSAHADYLSLIRTVECLNPECTIYVHGSGIEAR